MDIPALSISLNSIKTSNDVSTAVLGMALDDFKETGEDMTKMLEQSVQPYLGQNIDVKV